MTRALISHDSLHSTWTHLMGVGVGAFTCLTGDGDCCRPPVTLVTSDGWIGDLDDGLGGILGGVLWASSAPCMCTSIIVAVWKLASIL